MQTCRWDASGGRQWQVQAETSGTRHRQRLWPCRLLMGAAVAGTWLLLSQALLRLSQTAAAAGSFDTAWPSAPVPVLAPVLAPVPVAAEEADQSTAVAGTAAVSKTFDVHPAWRAQAPAVAQQQTHQPTPHCLCCRCCCCCCCRNQTRLRQVRRLTAI